MAALFALFCLTSKTKGFNIESRQRQRTLTLESMETEDLEGWR